STSDTAVVFTSDVAGKNVVYKLNTATPKAVFAWQVNNTVKENFGIVLDTVVSNNKDDVVVQAAVTKGDNVEAYARDYFTGAVYRSEEHTSELQSRFDLVCRLLLEKKK